MEVDMGPFDVPTQEQMNAYAPPTAAEAQAALDADRQRRMARQQTVSGGDIPPVPQDAREFPTPSNQAMAQQVAAQTQAGQAASADPVSKINAPDAEAAREQLRIASLGSPAVRGTPAYDARAAWSVQKGIPVPERVPELYETAYIDKQAAAVAQQEAAMAQFQASKEQADQIQQIQLQHQEELKQVQAQAYAKQAAALEPESLWERKGVFGGIMSALALGFGGVSSALTGAPNAALAIFQQEQAQDQALKMKRYELEGFDSQEVQKRILAIQSAQIQHISANIGEWASKAKTQEAQQNLLQAKAEFENMYGDKLMKLAQVSGDNVTEQWRHNAATGGGGGGLSPTTRIAIAKAYGDIGAQEQARLAGGAAGRKEGTAQMAQAQIDSLKQAKARILALSQQVGYLQTPETSGKITAGVAGAIADIQSGMGLSGMALHRDPLVSQLKEITDPSFHSVNRALASYHLEGVSKGLDEQIRQRETALAQGKPFISGQTGNKAMDQTQPPTESEQ